MNLIRVMVVAGLLMVAGLALAVRQGRTIPGAPEGRSAQASVGFLVLLAGCWLLAYLLVVRGLRNSQRARPVAALLATVAFGATAFLVMTNASGARSSCEFPTGECEPVKPTPTPTPQPSLEPQPPSDGFSVPVAPLLAVVAAVLLLAIVSVLVLVRRRPDPSPGDPVEALTRGTLRTAVEAAGYALRLGDGPRDSVIASYVAMERALAGAGAAPRPSDTPAEVLSRAAADGLIRGSAAEVLTELFRRARFSRHPITADHVRQAEGALAAVRDDLTAVEEDV